MGVTNVGLFAKTFAPEPVSSVSAASRLAEVNDPNTAALPVEVTMPVRLALVVTLPAVKPAAVPVAFVSTTTCGVPNKGVTRDGLTFSTFAPVPVVDVEPVPPLEAGTTPAAVITAVNAKSLPVHTTVARLSGVIEIPVVGPAPTIFTLKPPVVLLKTMYVLEDAGTVIVRTAVRAPVHTMTAY
jgi:hypothetical protein